MEKRKINKSAKSIRVLKPRKFYSVAALSLLLLLPLLSACALPRSLAMFDLMERRKAKVDFYAQVVDQHGEPVAGARINVVGANQNWYTSDALGLFRIKGRAEAIRIDLVQHPQLSAFKHQRGDALGGGCPTVPL